MRLVFRIILSVNSIMLLGFFYSLTNVNEVRDLVAPMLWLGFSVFISFLCVILSKLLSHDMIEGGIQSVELANEAYLPVYLGYFFIGFSITNIIQLWIAVIVLFILLVAAQTVYYNPFFHLFGFRFYYITRCGEKILVISRRKIHGIEGLSFYELRRINDYTFMDIEKSD
ncbi:hypothetical protein [Butyrivibrio sp. YAB3001]|uniref:hypothetical protein n=1 Tax=Butyrivibrio sp. YAB3001 TaxID=1520812 RepID=UPI0008F64E51|nr:hypothetical protein [Butyrivibrio sp. YAB3001]SFD00408.1 hypothetical protein SAMN02910398_03758 [Butyrivibrio sp. YAB3001]